MDWPPDSDSLAVMLHSVESTLLERKREWYDFGGKAGRAEFAKDVLAMANATREGLPGHIIIGVEDEKAGGAVVGVENPPATEQLQNILTSYTSPVPELHCAHVQVGQKTVSVLRIVWTPSHPYYASRNHERVLDMRSVYMRRGDTIVHLHPRELEDLIRRKDSHVGPPAAGLPLRVGFVEASAAWLPRVVAQVVNVTDEPVAGVTIIWDVKLAAIPGSLARSRSRTDYPIKPGEVVEVEIDPRKQWFLVNGEPYSADTAATRDRWFDIRVCVQYRDASGLIQEIDRFLTLSD